MRWLILVCAAACRFQHGAAPADSTTPPPDVDPNLDTDGDGIPDVVDNCPTVVNPEQHDWDMDGHGDECDRCPHLASDDDPDTDGDGVGDACDPRPDQPGDQRLYWLGFYDPSEIATWNTTGAGAAWSVSNGVLVQSKSGDSLLDSPDARGDLYFATAIEVVKPATYEIGFCGGDIQPGAQYYCCTVYNNPSSQVRAVSAWTGQPQMSSPMAFPGSVAPGARISIVGTMSSTASTCTFSQGTASVTSSTPRGPAKPGTAAFYTVAPANYEYAFVVAIGS